MHPENKVDKIDDFSKQKNKNKKKLKFEFPSLFKMTPQMSCHVVLEFSPIK